MVSNENILTISPHKGPYKASAAISLDYESSAVYGDLANWKSRLRGRVHRALGSTGDLSFCYGLGYAMRSGADNIREIFRKYDARATWFATGHALLKHNCLRQAFRINQTLPYATARAGFSDVVSWRRNRPTFSFEKFSDYQTEPYWYLGDQTRRLAEEGNDVQCHTFSHPHVALECPENMKVDLEDWQNAALSNDLPTAQILAFPFAGDCYRHYRDSNLKALHSKALPEKHDLCLLPDETLNILTSNGIELVTRCASKPGQRMAGFAPYYDSGLYFMADYDIAGLLHGQTGFSKLLSCIIENSETVDFWLHPSNVITDFEVENFGKIVRELTERSRQDDLWFAPISELWQHFKRVQKCRLEIGNISGAECTIALRNFGDEAVEELSCSKLIAGKLTASETGVTETAQKIIVRQLNPGEEIRFNYTILKKNGHTFNRTAAQRTVAS